jgi:TolB-like protein
LFALSLPPVRWLILGRPPEPALDTPFAPQKHVAVLPFGVVGDQASLGHIAVGIAEDLSRRLTRVRELTVTLPAAVESAAAEKPFDRVARDLGVNLIASGTIQGGSERLLVVVNLDDIPAKRRIWRE